MSRNCCPPKDIQMPMPEDPKCVPYDVLPNRCANPFCERTADHGHHTVRRSFTQGWWTQDYALLYDRLIAIKVPLCLICHGRCHNAGAHIEFTGSTYFWDNRDGTRLTPLRLTEMHSSLGEGGAVAGPQDEKTPPLDAQTGSPPSPSEPEPGQTCPTCHRRVNHTHKKDSPKSSVVSQRMPVAMKADFVEIAKATADHLGCGEEPYGVAKAMLTSMAYVLTLDPKKVASEIGKRIA